MGQNWHTGSSDLGKRLAAIGHAATARDNMTERQLLAQSDSSIHSITYLKAALQRIGMGLRAIAQICFGQVTN